MQRTQQILKEGSCEVSFCPSCMTMSDSNGSLGDGLSDIEKHSDTDINHTDGNYVDGYSSQRQQFQTLSDNIHESLKSQKETQMRISNIHTPVMNTPTRDDKTHNDLRQEKFNQNIASL